MNDRHQRSTAARDTELAAKISALVTGTAAGTMNPLPEVRATRS
jgi:hypothetical protein